MKKMIGMAVVLGWSVVFGAASLPEARAEDSAWEEMGNSDGISTWRRDVPGTSIVAFRGETIIDASIAKVSSVLDDTSRRLEWVHSAKAVKKIRIFSPLERIEYNHTGVPWPLRDRDFVYHASIAIDRDQKQVVIKMRSVDDPEMPVSDCCVRGRIAESSYILTSIDEGKRTRISVEINADPQGSIPKWLVNLFQKSWPRKTLQGIRDQVKKKDVQELVMVRDYLEGRPVPDVDALLQPVSGEKEAEPKSAPAEARKKSVRRGDALKSSVAAPVR